MIRELKYEHFSIDLQKQMSTEHHMTNTKSTHQRLSNHSAGGAGQIPHQPISMLDLYSRINVYNHKKILSLRTLQTYSYVTKSEMTSITFPTKSYTTAQFMKLDCSFNYDCELLNLPKPVEVQIE